MSQHAATPPFEVPGIRSLRAGARQATGYWWAWVLAGVAWTVAALVILKFDEASVTTVGVLVGLLFVGAAIENFALAALELPARWVWALFGGLFLACAIACFAQPVATFGALADMLGFLFLIVGVWWMVRAFLERPVNPQWWFGLVSGVLMTAIAFWTSGQFFIHRAYVLLVFAGIWALMQGVSTVTRGLELRRLHEAL